MHSIKSSVIKSFFQSCVILLLIVSARGSELILTKESANGVVYTASSEGGPYQFSIPNAFNGFTWAESTDRSPLSTLSTKLEHTILQDVTLGGKESQTSFRIHTQLNYGLLELGLSDAKPDPYVYQSATGSLFFRAYKENAKDNGNWKWKWNPTRPGTYQAWAVISHSSWIEKVNFQYEDKTSIISNPFSMDLESSQSSPITLSLSLGKLFVDKGADRSFGIQIHAKDGSSQLSLPSLGSKQVNGNSLVVILIPTTEGEITEQATDGGEILLHSKNSTLHSVKLQYEPQPHKITNGYWVNPNDKFFWDFKVSTPGKYKVEIHQGCGKGHGGSLAAVEFQGKDLTFTVKDTGHFQNFVPRNLGEIEIADPGIHRLWVKALKKAKVAVMDVRMLKLIPVN